MDNAFRCRWVFNNCKGKTPVENYKRMKSKRSCSVIHFELLLIPEHEHRTSCMQGACWHKDWSRLSLCNATDLKTKQSKEGGGKAGTGACSLYDSFCIQGEKNHCAVTWHYICKSFTFSSVWRFVAMLTPAASP